MRRKDSFSHSVAVTFANGKTDQYATILKDSMQAARNSAAYDLRDARITARQFSTRIVSRSVVIARLS